LLQENQADQPKKMVAICADDYGIDAQIDQAILDLAGQGRLTGASVLVDAPISAEMADALSQSSIDIGLHLNFTEVLGEMSQQQVMPLRTLILRAHARLLSRAWVKQSIERQLERFETLFHRVPDYVDGHLHVHQLPVIAEQLIASLSQRQLPGGFWIRDTRAGALAGSPWSERFKSWVIGHLGMSGLARRAQAAQLQTNRGFYGVYDFSAAHRAFLIMMQQWLAQAQTGALIMTHPARQAVQGDPMAQARVQEYEGLGSEEFAQLLATHGVQLGRASQMLSGLP